MNNCFRIREIRKANGMTQAQLAFRMNMKSPSSIAMWESGDRNPSSAILPMLADALNCTVDDLYQSRDQSK